MSDGVTFDAASVERVMKAMSAETYVDLLGDLLTDVTHVAEAEAKARTPVVTGHLRRSEISDVSHVRDASNPYGQLEGRTPYAEYIETGEWPGGSKRLRTRPDGYRMFEEGRKAAEGVAGRLLSKAAREMARRWAAA